MSLLLLSQVHQPPKKHNEESRQTRVSRFEKSNRRFTQMEEKRDVSWGNHTKEGLPYGCPTTLAISQRTGQP